MVVNPCTVHFPPNPVSRQKPGGIHPSCIETHENANQPDKGTMTRWTAPNLHKFSTNFDDVLVLESLMLNLFQNVM